MSIVGRLRDGLRRTARRWTSRLERLSGTSGSGGSSAETLEALEELLIEADVGVLTAGRIVARVGEEGGGDLRERVKTEIRGVLAGAAAPPAEVPAPRVVLVVGVNGTGKTTTVGKLAHRCRLDGRMPLICAADTFRAAAVEQIAVWAERASVDIVRAADGADPAAVVFDAISAARARGRDVVFVDTAGRLHTRADLMGELGKIRRVAGRAAPGAPHEVLLVVDASVGQNGISQARRFLETAGVTGIVLTKLDGTAKGGVAVAIAGELGVPIRYVGVGEGIDDLLPFSAGDYVDALFEKAW
ncbi:MAG: signal recognition particle-docking protein FtsY [Acidobacteriota bacterium]|nr:signal recognition particle-docking protein FtsY [Acidobacteriota bacterium]